MANVWAYKWRRVLTTNATDTSFASNIPTATDPGTTSLTTGVIDLAPDGIVAPETLFLQFFGAGSDDQTFDAKVIGFQRGGNTSNEELWTTCLLADVSVTLSTLVGVAGKLCIDTDRFADTITANDGIVIVHQSSDANSIVATAEIDTLGCSRAKVIFDLTGSTNANALWRVGGLCQ